MAALQVHVELNEPKSDAPQDKLLSNEQQNAISEENMKNNNSNSNNNNNNNNNNPNTDNNNNNNNNNGDKNKDKNKDKDDESKVKALFADIENMGRSVFDNEATASKYWLAFITIYWTLGIGIPIVINFDPVQPGFFTWCLGAIGMFSTLYTIRDGKYPSGSTREDPNGVNGVGRYSATMLVISIIIDLAIISYYGFDSENGGGAGVISRGILHLISIVWASLFFYNRFRSSNPDVATAAFWSEWLDLLISIIAILIMHNDPDVADRKCFSLDICIIYFVFVVVQLIGWVLPMMIISGWGSERGASNVCLHLFVLDLCSDLPVITVLLSNNNYQDYGIVFFDTVWKTCLLIRSTSYYVVYRLWLDKGKKVFEGWKNHEIPKPKN